MKISITESQTFTWFSVSLRIFFSFIINDNLMNVLGSVSCLYAHSTDTLGCRIVNNKGDHFMTSSNFLLRFEAIKCVKSEI
jgi:hypothetical protein